MNNSSFLTHLTPHHSAQLASLIHFTRSKRLHILRDLSSLFASTSRRLSSSTYTVDEVVSLINDIQNGIISSIENELIEMGLTGVAMGERFMRQAEKWGFKLIAEVEQLENRALLNALAKFEEELVSLKSKTEPPPKLTPVVDKITVLHSEIEKLKGENSRLLTELEQLRAIPKLNQSSLPSIHPGSLAPLQSSPLLSPPKLPTSSSTPLTKLTDTQQVEAEELTRLRHEVKEFQCQLDAKFQNTKQYQMLKKMLERKNANKDV